MLVSRRFLLLTVSFVLGTAVCAESSRAPTRLALDEKEKKAAKPAEKALDKIDLNDLHFEVVALQVLADLQVTPGQSKLLADLAKRTAEKPGPRRDVEVGDKYRKALLDLRSALVADDGDAIEKANGTLEKLRDKEAPDFDEVEITDSARKHAPALLKQLSARQVVIYVAGVADFPDPGEKLLDALSQSRELTGKEWRELRDAALEDVGWLVGGLDAKAEQKAREQALALLNKSHRLTEKEYGDQKAALEKEARDLTGKVGPTDVVRHYMERSLAELLSNPRLSEALAARRKKK